MAKHGKKSFGSCVYCGWAGDMTNDHVVPECLFIPPLPSDIPQVLACHRCNNDKKSLDDTFLRDVLVTDITTQKHPVAQQLFQTTFLSAIKLKTNKRGRVIRQSPLPKYAERGRYIDLFTPGGLWVDRAYTFETPPRRMQELLTRMVQGLHHVYRKTPFPEGATTTVTRIYNLSEMLPVAQNLVQIGAGHYTPVGDGSVFNCLYAYDPAHPNTCLWFLSFYSSVVYTVAINL